MARCKPYNLKQGKWVPLSYADQILPGSFEYALNEIAEEHLDLSVFERHFADLANPEMQPHHWQPDVCQPGHLRIEVGRAGKLL